MIRLFANTPSKRSDSSTKSLSDLAPTLKAGTIEYRPEIQTPQVFVVVNGKNIKMDITSRQRADSLPTVPHTTGELQILLEYEVAQDSLAGFHDFRWIFPDITSVTVGLFDFSCLTNANLAPHGNAANEWSICTSCPIQGRVVVQPLSLKTTVCSSEFLGSWETLSTALNEDPIIQTVIETASGKKDPKPASSFSQPFSSFSTPDFMKPTQPSVWKAPLSASPPIARQCLVLQTVPPRCLLPPRLRQSFSSQIPTPHPVADFWSCTDLVCLQPDLRPSANIPLQKELSRSKLCWLLRWHLSDMSVWHAPIIQARMHSTFRGSYPFILHDDFMNEYGVLNVRLKEAWYLPMTEITTLSSEFLIEGILVNSLLLCGASFQNNLAELMPKDSDGVAYYTADAIGICRVCVSGNSPLPPMPIQLTQ
ncbi:hypothetical protein BLNAU_12174 [Blattamonas nauphoetae]|uniref:Uncharacterized protein n=1 Tax=Blattamonas nauphoetae TaxID=2049346 RepID=A0ABQ9XK97_9EUKA|nr:hypothetical protein BLNAU_12174 [Blattamonas nauphoetae]